MRVSKWANFSVNDNVQQCFTCYLMDMAILNKGVKNISMVPLEEKICGLGISELRRLLNLEEKNARLGKLATALSLDK